MSCCSRGCEPCYSYYVSTGQHDNECCGGSACHGDLNEKLEAQRMRERTEANQRAEQVIQATNNLAAKIQELGVAVATAELQMRVMREAKEESVRDELRRLAQQQQEEEEAEQTRAAIEARQAELKNRQEAKFSVQPEPEKPKEQKPKVVHIKARQAVARQKVTQHERG